MSWKATAAIKDLKGVTRSEKLLLLILADYHNEKTGQCNPRIRDIAEDALLGPRRVQQLLTALEGRGFVAIAGRSGGAGSAQYWLCCIGYTPEKYSPLTPEIFSPVPPKEISGEGRNSPQSRGEIPHGGTPEIPHAPHIEPQLEPQSDEPKTEPQAAAAALDGWQEVRTDFENTLGLVGGAVLEEAKGYARLVPTLWFRQALEVTRDEAERPNWKFTKAVLDRALNEQRAPKQEIRKREPDTRSARGQLLARLKGVAS